MILPTKYLHSVKTQLFLSTEDVGSFYCITDQKGDESNRSKEGWE